MPTRRERSPPTRCARADDELIDSHRICAGTRRQLTDNFTDAQIMDVIAIHGMYVIPGCMINTWGLTLDAQIAERISAYTSELDFNAATGRFHSEGKP